MEKQRRNTVSIWLLNWLVKALIITIVPFVIGLIDNATEWKDKNGSINNIFISGKFFVILLTVLYIAYIIYVAFNERKQDKNNQTIEKLIKDKTFCNLSLDVYKMTFERTKGTLTKKGTEKLDAKNCPNCGAPLKITSSGKCEYCGSIVSTGVHDWVLSNIEPLRK